MKIKEINANKIFDFFNITTLILILIVILYPLYFVIIASVSAPGEIVLGNVIFLPKGLNIEGYTRIFEDSRIVGSYLNTLVYTLIGTLVNIILTITISYPLSCKKYSLRSKLMVYLMITMYVYGGMIPGYLLIDGLGLIDKWYVMVFVNAVSVYNIIITKTFIQNSIPDELYESASIDGCNHFTYFFKFIVPLSKPILAVLVLYYGVAHWNDYMKALLYLTSEDLFPLQMILRNILIENQSQEQMSIGLVTIGEKQQVAESIKYASIVVASIPPLIVYPFLQKYFAKGVMIGSVKG